MTSKDDDTLPLPGFSQELSIDTTIDEDFIPTSQPQSSKTSRNSETSYDKSTEELKCSDSASESRIDDTLPPEAAFDQSALDKDKSADFIPDMETKKPTYGNADPACKKKLPVFGTGEIFLKVESNSWDVDSSKVPERPILETENISILNDSPTRILPSGRETLEKYEESITEIIVNDSSETVDLDTTPVRIKTSQGDKTEEKLEISGSPNGETQIFDNSTVLLSDQPETDRSGLDKSEVVSDVASEKSYHQETVDYSESHSGRTTNGFESKYSPPLGVAEVSGKYNTAEKVVEGDAPVVPKQEVQPNSTCSEPNSTSIITRKIEFKLTVSCFVTLNAKTNKVLQKIILNVNETPKPKSKPVYVEPLSDNTSEKSKRYSTSSSGSVYSDKTGPFALPKRVSAISDQTDSSEEDFGMLPKKERRAMERIPWSNEYLLPLKMDDIMLASVENQEFFRRPSIASSPMKFKSKLCNGINNLKEILESSSSEQTSVSYLVSGESRSVRTSPSGKETPESSEPILGEDKQGEESEGGAEKKKCKNNAEEENSTAIIREAESAPEPANKPDVESKQEEVQISSDELCDGLAVFARWTDKRYYSGVLCGSLKNDRWEVKFDDGTLKAVRKDFIMPAAWLKTGSLVFAGTDDKYESGQIIDLQRGEEVRYVVELDTEKREISVKISDLCLTDVMVGIVREKYKPLSGTAKGKADIDFDNIVSGKRLREQRTPLRPAVPTESSGAKKKSSSKSGKKDFHSIKENSEQSTGKKIMGLKSENGHLVEDKVISADSPSGTEATETPLRRAEEARKKAKPRSLSYEAEESRWRNKKLKIWLEADGTPIPGPSGVKFKKQKAKAKEKERPIAKSYKSPRRTTASTEKSRKKMKLDVFVEDGAKKKSRTEEDSRMKTRSGKGRPKPE